LSPSSGSPTCQAYSSVPELCGHTISRGVAHASQLPFTGINLVVVLAVAVLLVAAGLALRVTAR
jgi:hypothetical protein